MTTLVEDLLLLARLDSGRPVVHEWVDLCRLVADAVADAHVAGPGHKWLLERPRRADRRPRRRGPAAPGGDQRPGQRAHAHPGGHDGDDDTVHIGRSGPAPRGRRRPGHPAGHPPGRLRAVRPRRQLALPRGGQHRARAGDRGRGGRRARRPGRGAQPSGADGVRDAPSRRPPRKRRTGVGATDAPTRASEASRRDRRHIRLACHPAGGCTAHAQLRHKFTTCGADTVGTMTTTLSAPEHAQPAPEAARKPRWIKPSVAALLLGTGLLYLWDLGEDRLGQRLLRDGRAGRHVELEGAVLRLARPGQRRHRRQAAVLAVGHGVVRRGSSASRAGACWCRTRSPASPRSACCTSPCGGCPGPGAGLLAGAGLALTPGRRADVPVRQPRRLLVLLLVAGAYCVVRALETASTKLAAARRGRGRVRLPRQDAAGVPRAARVRAGVRGRGADVARPPDRPAASPRPARWSSPRAGGSLVVALWPVADRPYISGSTDNTRAGAGVRLQRPRPDLR